MRCFICLIIIAMGQNVNANPRIPICKQSIHVMNKSTINNIPSMVVNFPDNNHAICIVLHFSKDFLICGFIFSISIPQSWRVNQSQSVSLIELHMLSNTIRWITCRSTWTDSHVDKCWLANTCLTKNNKCSRRIYLRVILIHLIGLWAKWVI